MDAGIIINPIAGSKRRAGIERRVDLARSVIRDCGIEGQVAVTQKRGHAAELARSLVECGVSRIVAWGGDGTVNEVASQVAFHEATLGIVPGGSGNGLARELGLPHRSPELALRVALQGDPRLIDVGELGGRFFFNVAGVGLDAHLAAAFNELTSRGPVGYARVILRELLTYEPSYYVLRASDVALSQTALIVALANTRQYGNNALIAPLARPDDGLLELVVLPPLSPLAALWEVRRLFTGTAHEVPGVTMQSIRSVQIAGDALRWFHVDGEVVAGSDTLEAKIHPKSLRVSCGSAGKP